MATADRATVGAGPRSIRLRTNRRTSTASSGGCARRWSATTPAGRTLRDAHPKMHGCVRGEFSIEPNLPEHLRVGIFAQPQTFPAWIRFSNRAGPSRADSKGDIRGAAIKLMDVHGSEARDDRRRRHDARLHPDQRQPLRHQGRRAVRRAGRRAHRRTARRWRWFFLTHPRAARNLWVSLKRFSNPLGIRYFSVAPYLLGSRRREILADPARCRRAAAPSELLGRLPARSHGASTSVAASAVFDFSVQLQIDPDAMPIEDPGITLGRSGVAVSARSRR